MFNSINHNNKNLLNKGYFSNFHQEMFVSYTLGINS